MATIRKLIVEVVEARNLLPKDGHGTSSPYVILDFYGQRRMSRTVIQDLNPAWNETTEFNVEKPSDVFGDMLELEMYHDRKIGPTTGNNFLGRIRLNSRQFVTKGEEVLIYYPLEKRSLFSLIQGEIGLKIYFVDEAAPPPATPAPPTPPPEEAMPEQAPPPAPAAAAPACDSPSPPPPPPEATEPVAEKSHAPPESNLEPHKEPPSDGEKPTAEQPPEPPAEAAFPPENTSDAPSII